MTHQGGENTFAFCLLKAQFSYAPLHSLRRLFRMHLNFLFHPEPCNLDLGDLAGLEM